MDEEYNMIERNNLTTATTESIEQQMVMTRFFDASPELVFKTYIHPGLIPRWWFPKRTTTYVIKMDVRPRGIWRFVQRDSDGDEYIFNGMYHEIRASTRLLYTFEFEGILGHVIAERVIFEEEQDGKTKLTSESFFQTVEDRDIMLNLRVGGCMAESMDRLAELLKYLKYIHKGKMSDVICCSKHGLSLSARWLGRDRSRISRGKLFNE